MGTVTPALNNVDALFGTLPYKEQFNQYTNTDSLQMALQEKAITEATDYFAQHAEKLLAAQGKVNKLAGKYREYSNSNDLTNAVKRTSLQGNTIWERMVVGGNFNLIGVKPLVLDCSPQIGYRLNTRFTLGVGVSARLHFSKDSLRYPWHVSNNNFGYKVFSNVDLIKNFYGSIEWEYSSLKIKPGSGSDTQERKGVNNVFAGIGRKLLIHPKLVVTILMQYNFNSQENNPLYPRKFQGVQTSDLAFRKRRISYDPNR